MPGGFSSGFDSGFGGGAGVTDALVAEALAGQHGAVSLRYAFEQRDHRYNFEADVTEAVTEASIELDNERPVTRTARFSIRADLMPVGFDPAADHIAVQAVIVVPLFTGGIWTYPEVSYPLGLFHLDAPKRRFSANAHETWEVEASDIVVHLITAKTPNPYVVASGTNYITAVETICALLGFNYVFPPLAAVTPVAFSWAPGTAYLDIVNALLGGINYYPLWATGEGTLTSSERILPSQSAPAVSYTTAAEPRMAVSPFERLIDQTRYANRIVVVIDDPRRSPAYVLRVNDDPASGISVTNLGVVNSDPPISGGRVLDLATATDIVEWELEQRAAASEQGTLSTFPDPRRTAHEFYTLTIEAIETATLWMVRGWQLALRVGAAMQHTLGATLALSQSIVVTLSGTILTATEAQIVAGGRTLILTLPTGYSWVTAGALFDAQRQNIINGLVSAGTEGGGWNTTVVPAMVVTNVVRTSASIVTITLPAVAGYAITLPEAVHVSVPTTAIDGGFASYTEPDATIIPT